MLLVVGPILLPKGKPPYSLEKHLLDTSGVSLQGGDEQHREETAHGTWRRVLVTFMATGLRWVIETLGVFFEAGYPFWSSRGFIKWRPLQGGLFKGAEARQVTHLDHIILEELTFG